MNLRALVIGTATGLCMWAVLAAIVVGWLVSDAEVAAWLAR